MLPYSFLTVLLWYLSRVYASSEQRLSNCPSDVSQRDRFSPVFTPSAIRLLWWTTNPLPAWAQGGCKFAFFHVWFFVDCLQIRGQQIGSAHP